MKYNYLDIVPSFVENAQMQLKVDELGNLIAYRITPNEGYVLHDSSRDWHDVDPITGVELEELILGYTTGTATCAATYDFDKNERCFCTERIEDIPAEHIF